jgi:putative SOS response-associated peptidase YedK
MLTVLRAVEQPRSTSYENPAGKAERWAIASADGQPFCLAGLWRAWPEADGSVTHSFTQITINADDHPVMRRFHKPGEEKRSVVIVPETEWDSWLACRNPEVARLMLTLFPPELLKTWQAEPQPRAKAICAPRKNPESIPAGESTQGVLF